MKDIEPEQAIVGKSLKVVAERIKEEKQVIEAIKEVAPKIFKANKSVNIRVEPSMAASVIGVVEKDNIIRVIKEKDGWFCIENGWTKKEFYTEEV